MARGNRGGRPNNDWTPSRVRKLGRLTTFSSINVKTIQQTLARVEDGFEPCLRDVYKQLATIQPEIPARTSRRHNGRMSRIEQTNLLEQLKPGRESPYPSASVPPAVDAMYNPLAHWDYFADTRFVTLGQVTGSGAIDAHSGDTSGQANYQGDTAPNLYTCEATSAHGPQISETRKRDIRKTKLRSIIAQSELSFVVSLLSSSWSKSCLHTRALSYAPMTDQICDSMWKVPDPDADSSSAKNGQRLALYSTSKPTFKSLSLVWRPCCGLYKVSDDPTWKCHTCGFSSALHKARFPQRQQEVTTFSPNDRSSSINDLTDIISNIQMGSALSDNDSLDGQFSNIHGEDESSATLEYLESRLQSIIYEENQEILSTVIGNWDSPQLNEMDRFGNTALHHAAEGRNFDAILPLLGNGIPPQALNTHGQTFLHLLDVGRDFERYLDVLRQIISQTASFPFGHKDHYGTTISYRFGLSAENTEHTSPEIISEIQSLLGNPHLFLTEGGHMPTDLDFDARCDAFPVEDWASGDPDIAIEIDKHGNTCLIAILKRWSFDRGQEKLIALINKLTTNRELKADLDAHDNEGQTPLAIAAGKGLCSAVHRLLQLGANPNTRTHDWVGQSVLQIVKTFRQTAKDRNSNKLHTAILQCEKWLVEFGAEEYVSALSEYSVTTTYSYGREVCDKFTLSPGELEKKCRSLYGSDIWIDLWRLCLRPSVWEKKFLDFDHSKQHFSQVDQAL